MTNIWLVALILGIVEGFTEYLPISSTGHLILVSHAIGFTGAMANDFNIFIQFGAILSVLVLYRARLLHLVRDLPTDPGARKVAGGIVLVLLWPLRSIIARSETWRPVGEWIAEIGRRLVD